MLFLTGSVERLHHIQLLSCYPSSAVLAGTSCPRTSHVHLCYTPGHTCSPHTMETLLWWDETKPTIEHVQWMGTNILVSSSTTFGDSSTNLLRVAIVCFYLLLQVLVVISKKRPLAQVELYKFMWLSRHDLQVVCLEHSNGTHWPGPKR